MERFSFPALGVLNEFLLGDTVLTEPIARGLALSESAYVVSNYPELFIGHPTVRGVRSFDELPLNCRIIDLKKSIQSIEGKGEDKHVVPHKFLNMCKEAGFQRELDAPRLYLTPREWTTVQEMRHFFPDRPNVGVVFGSAHVAKRWMFMERGIKHLLKDDYNVFIFGTRLDKTAEWGVPDGCYQVFDRPLREMMQYIAMMDLMLGSDTGPMHVAGSLGVPLTVVCFKVFADLYAMYENVEVLDSDNFTFAKGIKGVSVKTAMSVVRKQAKIVKRESPVFDLERMKSMAPKHHAFIRMRGIGDIILSLPAIATLKSMNGNKNCSYTYITTPAGKKLLECVDIFDEVRGVDYDHSHKGFPLPPDGIDYSKFDTCANLINAIDFLPQGASLPRTELFASAIGIESCDYQTDWRFSVPEKWKDDAWEILTGYGIVEGDKILAFQVDTKGLSRSWPKARQVEFCGRASKHGWKIVLLSDKVYTKYPKHCINLTGCLSVSEYVGIIAVSTVGLSPDSALLHIAGAMGKDAVGLFGAVDPELRIAHYDTVHPIVGKAKCVPCNDWQRACCKDTAKRWPICMWNIKSGEVLDTIDHLAMEVEK